MESRTAFDFARELGIKIWHLGENGDAFENEHQMLEAILLLLAQKLCEFERGIRVRAWQEFSRPTKN